MAKRRRFKDELKRRRRRAKREEEEEMEETRVGRGKRLSKLSTRRRRWSRRQEDIVMFSILAVIIGSIIGGYFVYREYYQEEEGAGFGEEGSKAGGQPTGMASGSNRRVIIDVTSVSISGRIEIELYEDKAPITTSNFIKYVKDGFYNGLIFHRVISDFMIQGGGFDQDMNEKPVTYPPIKNEAKDSGLSNIRGTIAMARTSDPDSATSQFFINVEDNDGSKEDGYNLDPGGSDPYGYAVFGKVIAGMNVVDKIRYVPTHTEKGHENVPIDDVIMTSVELIEVIPD